MDTILHYSQFPATGVSLRQMVQFGQNPSAGSSYTSDREFGAGSLSNSPSSYGSSNPSSASFLGWGDRVSNWWTGRKGKACANRACASPGTLFRASQFLSEELPIRLAHRVKELNELPDGLNEMPSIQKVANWYAQSFEVSHSNIWMSSF